MSEESEEVPPEECPPGYEWDWEQGKCIVPDPSDDWWEGTDSGEDSIPSDGLGGSISFGLMIASLFQGAQGAWESEESVDWWDSSAPGLRKIEDEEGGAQRDLFGGHDFTPQEDPGDTQSATPTDEDAPKEEYASEDSDTGYSSSDKACESGLPELALGSDFEERENKIGLIDIIAPDVDDWENEVEGSILMDAALSSIAAEFESDFDFGDVNYNSRFEAGESMEISYTSFEDLWGEERQIYWDFMYSSEHAPVFAHSYYDDDDDPVDEQFLAEGVTTVGYNSDELKGLKERFGSDYTWPEIIDNTITSLFEEVLARSYQISDSMQKHSYDIFKFGVFTSLALGEEVEMEESDLGINPSTMSTTSTTSY